MLWFEEWGNRRRRSELVARFLAKVKIVQRSECLEWVGAVDNHGYGAFRSPLNKGGTSKAHRVSYWIFRGPVPPSKSIDHLCRFTKCVNPYHLRLVDSYTNTALGNIDRHDDGGLDDVMDDLEWEDIL